jgi:predicted dehydrogenase
MRTEPIRIGIVGCGVVMRYPYTRQIRRLRANDAPIAVTRACDINPAAEAVVRQRFGAIPFDTDYRKVVEADDVDLVLVLTSMAEHAPIAGAALRAGKHVLVEKPMATTLDDAAALMEVAQHSPGLLLPAPHVVLSPTYQAIWRQIKRGAIGQPLQARAIYGWDGPDWGPWFYQRGGGPLFDLGIYNVISLTGLLGPAKRVMGMVGTARPERPDLDRVRQHGVCRDHGWLYHAKISRAGHRGLRQRGHDPDAGRRLEPQRLRAVAKQRGCLAGV